MRKEGVALQIFIEYLLNSETEYPLWVFLSYKYIYKIYLRRKCKNIISLFLSPTALLDHITGHTVLFKEDKLQENWYYLFSILIVNFPYAYYCELEFLSEIQSV